MYFALNLTARHAKGLRKDRKVLFTKSFTNFSKSNYKHKKKT